MDPDGSNKFKVTDTTVESATDAAFSSDGQWIIYSSENSNTTFANIYRINIDGTNRQRLTDSSDYDGTVSLTSSMSKIAFESINVDPDTSAGTKIWILDITAFDTILRGFH